MIKIYLTTYKKYASGSLSGLWIDLPMTKTGLRQKMQKAAFPERICDAEFMIADTECPRGLDFRAISESESVEKLNEEIAELKEEKAIEKLSPEVQKVIAEYIKAGESDPKWVKYHREKCSAAVELESGLLYEFELPSIETRFCFCEDVNGIYDKERAESAQRMARNAHEKDYFIRENMENAFRWVEKRLNADGEIILAKAREYAGHKTNLCYLVVPGRFGNYGIEEYNFDCWTEEDKKGYVIITNEDRKRLKSALAAEKEKFMARLEKWYKRYGADGIHSWTYYSD